MKLKRKQMELEKLDEVGDFFLGVEMIFGYLFSNEEKSRNL